MSTPWRHELHRFLDRMMGREKQDYRAIDRLEPEEPPREKEPDPPPVVTDLSLQTAIMQVVGLPAVEPAARAPAIAAVVHQDPLADSASADLPKTQHAWKTTSPPGSFPVRRRCEVCKTILMVYKKGIPTYQRPGDDVVTRVPLCIPERD